MLFCTEMFLSQCAFYVGYFKSSCLLTKFIKSWMGIRTYTYTLFSASKYLLNSPMAVNALLLCCVQSFKFSLLWTKNSALGNLELVGLGFKNKVTAVVFSSSVIGCVLTKAVSGNPQLAALLDLKRCALSMLMWRTSLKSILSLLLGKVSLKSHFSGPAQPKCFPRAVN